MDTHWVYYVDENNAVILYGYLCRKIVYAI